MFPCQRDKEVPVVSRILLPLMLQLKKTVLKRWASLWCRCGEFCEMILAYILTKSNWRKNWSRLNSRSWVRELGWTLFINSSNKKYALLVRQQFTCTPWVIINYGLIWFMAGGVMGPYFFRDDQDRHVSVNGNRYRSMITEYFWHQLDDMDLEDMWF